MAVTRTSPSAPNLVGLNPNLPELLMLSHYASDLKWCVVWQNLAYRKIRLPLWVKADVQPWETFVVGVFLATVLSSGVLVNSCPQLNVAWYVECSMWKLVPRIPNTKSTQI